ncbi:hypothetical protein GCM10011514_06610 [Emticicia aquatilis]|uniref:DUF5977 domain-containing protein n=1 Tax=Emticicia aquatilis TaxID=1537369 RepID=A0A916YH14_9BACT|nr:DUF5977 domain-containing protein [Emticicia aquatilis]GGD45252.1 hypothetical protein GCM10011514_06610 [Emticicia aquatilis]
MIIESLVDCNAIALDMTRNKIVVNVLAYDPVGVINRTGLEYFLEVWVPKSYNSGTYKLLGTLEAREEPKQINGTVESYAGAFFEISNLLDGMLETTKPLYAQDRISVCPCMVTPYYCIGKVKNNGVEVYAKTFTSRYAIKSGIAERDYELYKDIFFTQYIGGSRRFLTYKPITSVIQAGQTEFLSFLTNYDANITTIKLKMVAKMLDGSEVITTPQVLTGILPMNVYTIPIQTEDENLASCSVWLLNQNNERISEVRNYIVEQRYRRFSRKILFENSLGVFDTFTFFGESAENLTFNRQIGEQFIGYDYLAEASESVVRDVRARRKLSIAIDWSSKSVVDYLSDLLFSRKVYLETDRSHLSLLPLSDTFIPYADAEDWAGRKLEFVYSKEETNYSRLPIPMPVGSRATGWKALATVCELDSKGKYNGNLQVTMLEKIYLDDNSLVIPRQIKANVVGEEGYISPINTGSCLPATTPFLSALISREGTYVRNTCGPGLIGGYATIVIPAGTWGSTLNQADANAKAEADWQSKNTQAYADLYGACNAYPENYVIAGGVPVGRFWVRFSTSNKNATNNSGMWSGSSGQGYRPGNMWFCQSSIQADQTDVYPINTWDVHYPVRTSWNFYVYTDIQRVWKYYLNGVLKQTVIVNNSSNNWIDLVVMPQSGDRVYFSIE